jgi:hypothetical protein
MSISKSANRHRTSHRIVDARRSGLKVFFIVFSASLVYVIVAVSTDSRPIAAGIVGGVSAGTFGLVLGFKARARIKHDFERDALKKKTFTE